MNYFISTFLLILVLALPNTSLAQAFCIKKSGAFLRSSPSARAKVSWRVPKFMPLQATGKSVQQYVEVVDLEGQIHWALRGDLTKQLNCLVVKTKSAPLREGPGMNFNPANISRVDKYSAFVDLGGEDGWTLVEDDRGRQAWIDLAKTWKPRAKVRMSFDSEIQK